MTLQENYVLLHARLRRIKWFKLGHQILLPLNALSVLWWVPKIIDDGATFQILSMWFNLGCVVLGISVIRDLRKTQQILTANIEHLERVMEEDQRLDDREQVV